MFTTYTKIILIKLHANWCEKSKSISQFYDSIQNRFDGKPILFLDLNYTNQQSTHQAELLINLLGLSSVVKKNLETGKMLIIHKRSKKLLNKLENTLTFNEMESIVAKALKF